MAILACCGGGDLILPLCAAAAAVATPILAMAALCWFLAKCLCRY